MSFTTVFSAVFLAIVAAGAALFLFFGRLVEHSPRRAEPPARILPPRVEQPERSVAVLDKNTAEELREMERQRAREESAPPDEPYFVRIASPVQLDESTVLRPGTAVRLLERHHCGRVTIAYDGAVYDVRASQTDLHHRLAAEAAVAAQTQHERSDAMARPGVIELGIESLTFWDVWGLPVRISSHARADVIVHD